MIIQSECQAKIKQRKAVHIMQESWNKTDGRCRKKGRGEREGEGPIVRSQGGGSERLRVRWEQVKKKGITPWRERKWARVDEGETKGEEERLMRIKKEGFVRKGWHQKPGWSGEREGEQLGHEEEQWHWDVSRWRNYNPPHASFFLLLAPTLFFSFLFSPHLSPPPCVFTFSPLSPVSPQSRTSPLKPACS